LKTTKNDPEAPNVLDQGARELWDILTKTGPAGKTGLSGELALRLQRKVPPHLFDKILHRARRTLSDSKGQAIVYDSTTDQYGFAEDIEQGQAYILSFNSTYLATRCETMEIQARAVMAQHGETSGLRHFVAAAGSAAMNFRTIADTHAQDAKAWRAGRRTGARAKIEADRNGDKANA
jgi:hypothetical protein